MKSKKLKTLNIGSSAFIKIITTFMLKDAKIYQEQIGLFSRNYWFDQIVIINLKR